MKIGLETLSEKKTSTFLFGFFILWVLSQNVVLNKSIHFKMIAVFSLLLLLLLTTVSTAVSDKKYAWFTAMSNHADRYHFTLQAAIESVLQCCSDSLFPVIIMQSNTTELTRAPSWLRILHDNKLVLIHPFELSWHSKLSPAAKSMAPSYYRMEIPLFMNKIYQQLPFLHQDYVLYTDCDVMFFKLPEFIKPAVMTIGPELVRGNKDNNGVMFMNLTALSRTIAAYTAYASQHGDTGDQVLTLRFYNNVSTLLPDIYNWKPYWGHNKDVAIVHTHGLKVQACLEHFLFARYEVDHFFGAKTGCYPAGPYAGVLKYASSLYKISFEEQMRAYLKHTVALYKFTDDFDQRILKLNAGSLISTYSSGKK
jgi:hypothetical protein